MSSCHTQYVVCCVYVGMIVATVYILHMCAWIWYVNVTLVTLCRFIASIHIVCDNVSIPYVVYYVGTVFAMYHIVFAGRVPATHMYGLEPMMLVKHVL